MCTIDQVRVHLVAPPGGGAKELRVTGRAINCPTNQVVVTSTVTNPSAPVPVNAQGRFRVSLPVTQTVQCGDSIGVRVECNQNPSCYFEDTSLSVPCCTADIVYVQAQVPHGQLKPDSISVSGTLMGCYNDQVVVRIIAQTASGTTIVLGPSPATTVDPYTGTFNVTLQIPTNAGVECDNTITVEAWCAQDPTCRTQYRRPLDCLGCPRATVSYTAGQCFGQPPVQPVTLNADISIPAGLQYDFQWDYGDGSPVGLPFTVDNTLGTAATQHSHSAPVHNYNATPGNYTARLFAIGLECPEFTLPITVQCLQCPSVSGSATVGACETTQGSPNFGYRPVTYTLTFSPAIPQNAQVWVTWNYGGTTSTGATTFQEQIPTSAGPVPMWTHTAHLKHKPGGYPSSATVSVFHQGQPCAPSNIQFESSPGTTPPVVLVDPCIPCPERVDITRTSPANLPCAPTTSKLEFQASVVWPQGTANLPSPSGYDWTITLPTKQGQPTRQAKYTNGPNKVDTASGWTGNGATAAGAVELSDDGAYSVGVTAKFPASAGLPTNADGTSQCNLTGSDSFTLPSCCPKFLGQLNATEGDSPCEWLFSVQVDKPNEVQTFEWTLDGQPIPGDKANNSYTFSPGGITTLVVTVTMIPKSPNCPKQQLSTTININCIAAPPKVTSCSATPGSSGTGSLRVTFDSDVDPASVTNPANFSISIGGGPTQNPAPGSLSYDPTTRTTTISGLSINPGDSVSVTVTGLTGATGVAMTSPGKVSCSAPTGPPTGDQSMSLCDALLWVAIALMGIGAILVILGCLLAKPFPQAAGILTVVGWIVFAVGWVVFLLWWWLCSRFTACKVILAVRAFVGWLIFLFGLIALIIGIIGFSDPSLWPCAGLAFLYGLNWGLIYWILNQIAEWRGCLIRNPGGS